MATPAKTTVAAPAPAPGAAHGGPAATAPTIVADGLAKSFRIPLHQPSTLKERALHPFRRIPSTELRAVDDVSFEVAAGEFFGIVGRNGSGKSTLLKLLAGIYPPDHGTVRVNGRVSPFIELGVGFNPELAARDNVIINCSLLGLPRSEAIRRFDSIIEFAELEEFVDLKLKNYSSGMHVRLAFSTAIQVDADVLLLDEVLAVGDVGFQEKCFEVFRTMRADGRTIVLVTHSLGIVQRFCDRVMLLDRGRPVETGEPDEIVNRYRREEEAAAAAAGGGAQEGERHGDRRAEVTAAWFEDGRGQRIESCEQGDPLVLRVAVAFHDAMEHPAFGTTLHNERNEVAFAANTVWAGTEVPRFGPGDRAEVAFTLTNHLGVGRHHAAVGVHTRDGATLADYRTSVATVVVTGPEWTGAAADLPHEITVERR